MTIPKPLLIIISFLLFCGCSKEKQNPQASANNIKISLVSGNNQKAPVGYPLSDSIVIKITSNGSPVKNYYVRFIGSGCNEDLVTDLPTKADGTVTYWWIMAADQGKQTLKAIAIDGTKKIDSVNLTATAIAPVGMALRSACTPNPGGNAQRILQLSTGRLIACFPTQTSIRYSDDNGVSWYPIKSFGSSHTAEWITITPQDEIFAATLGEGIFYSKDAGNTWVNITPSTFNKQDAIYDITFTNSGKLIFTGYSNDTYVSLDKGKTWAAPGNGLASNAGYQTPIELKNGDLYLLSFRNILYKSTDNGKNWIAQNDYQNEHITSIYVDNNGWFYKASISPTSTAINDIIFISKDNGSTFTNLINFTPVTSEPYVTNMSMQSDGYLYFDELSSIGRAYNNGLITNTYAYTNAPFAAYILTKDNRFVYSNAGYISYY